MVDTLERDVGEIPRDPRQRSCISVRLEPAGRGRTAVIHAAIGRLAVGRGAVVCQAARALIDRGANPADRLEATRDTTPCLAGPLGAFAALDVTDDDDHTRFRMHSPGAPISDGRRRRSAPPMRFSRPRAPR